MATRYRVLLSDALGPEGLARLREHKPALRAHMDAILQSLSPLPGGGEAGQSLSPLPGGGEAGWSLSPLPGGGSPLPSNDDVMEAA